MAPRVVLEIPDRFPAISSGILLRDGKTLVTGHINGYVSKWDLTAKTPSIILRASSTVHGMAEAKNGDVFVGCQEGDLYRLYGRDLEQKEALLPPTNVKYARVFRLANPIGSVVLYTSTYGVVTLLQRTRHGWEKMHLKGHSHAVFAVACMDDKLIATGDYRGEIRVWQIEGSSVTEASRFAIDSYVSGLAFSGANLLSAIGSSGRTYIFEREADSGAWRTIFETEAATGSGRAIGPVPGTREVVAATVNELFTINPESQEIRNGRIPESIAIFPHKTGVLLLTAKGLSETLYQELKIREDLVQYEYLKVSLLGNTGSGKTTLCSALATGDPGDQLSTFGRKVWKWAIAEGPPERRVLLNDNGGQGQVVGTLLPLSADSDVLLFAFKQTDAGTFAQALDLHHQMLSLVGPRARSYLLETHTDNKLKAVTDDLVSQKVSSLGMAGVFRVAPTVSSEVEEFKKQLLGQLDWKVARRALQSTSAVALTETLARMRAAEETVSDVGRVKRAFEKTTGSTIYLYHLKFLLQNLADEGHVEYYPEIGDTVVIDDPVFNKLRTEIPILAGEQGGLVDWKEMLTKFRSNATYVAMLDRYYQSNGISIPFGPGDGRLFPAFLTTRPLAPPKEATSYIGPQGKTHERMFNIANPDTTRIFQALCEASLSCLDATRNEGLFSLGKNAFLWFHWSVSHDLLEGDVFKVRFQAEGAVKEAAASLGRDFTRLLDTLFGLSPKPKGGEGPAVASN